jgi:hypothetical protein
MILYKFIRHNTESLYGYGTRLEADQYLAWLDKHRGGNWYTQIFITSDGEAEKISFNMSDELIALAYYGDDDDDSADLSA